MRLVLYPYLLFRFWFALEGFGLERLVVVACQFLLCGFNGAMIYASTVRRMRRLGSRDDLWGLANLTPSTPQEKAAYKQSQPQPVVIRAQAGY